METSKLIAFGQAANKKVHLPCRQHAFVAGVREKDC